MLKGQGHIITGKGLEPSGEGDVVYSPRGCWHGFNNTSNEDVVLVWGWMGAARSRRPATKYHEGQSDDDAWDDPRIGGGMGAAGERRRKRIAGGAEPLGWKVGVRRAGRDGGSSRLARHWWGS